MRKFVSIHLLLATALLAPEAMSSSPCLRAELAKNLKTIVDNRFEVSRFLENYTIAMGEEFKTALSALRAQDKWIDFGAGHGFAVLEFLSNRLRREQLPSPKVIALSLTDPGYTRHQGLKDYLSRAPGFDNFFTNLKGRLLERIPDAELAGITLGTDYMGPLSYTRDVSHVLSKYVRALKDESSSLFLVINHNTKIRVGDKTVLLSEWIAGIPGLDVATGKAFTENGDHLVSLRVKRMDPNATIPRLELVSLTSGTPPERVFRQVAP